MANPSAKSDFLLTLETAYRILGFVIDKFHYLVAVFVVSALAAFAINSLKAPLYEASAVLVLSPPPIKQEKDTVTGLLPRTLTVQDYNIVIMADPVLKELRERTHWVDDDGKPERLSEIRRNIYTRVTVTKQTYSEVQHSPILVITTKGETGEEAAERANTWAEIAVEISQRYGRFGAGGTLEVLHEEFGKTRREFDGQITAGSRRVDELQAAIVEAEDRKATELNVFAAKKDRELAELAGRLQIDLLELRKKAALALIEVNLKKAAEADVQVRTLEQEVASLTERVGAMKDRLTLNKGFTDTALALLAVQGEDVQARLGGKTIVAEEASVAYQNLSEKQTEKMAELAGAREAKAALDRQIAEAREEFGKALKEQLEASSVFDAKTRELEAQMKTLELTLDREVMARTKQAEWESDKIKTELKDMGTYFSAVTAKTLGTRMAEAEIEPDLRVLSPAVGSLIPLPRNRAVKALATGVFAFVVALGVLLIVSGYREHSMYMLQREQS